MSRSFTSCSTRTASETISICLTTSCANGKTITITTGPTEPSTDRPRMSGFWQGKPLPASHRSPETTRVLSPHRLELSVRLHSRISPARQLVASAKSTIGCSRLRASFRTRIFGAACSPSPGSSMPIPKPHIIGKTCGASQVTDCVKSYIAATSRSAPIQQDESGARSDQL